MFFQDVKESVKDAASRGVDSVKETGSKIADKGHGKILFELLMKTWC